MPLRDIRQPDVTRTDNELQQHLLEDRVDLSRRSFGVLAASAITAGLTGCQSDEGADGDAPIDYDDDASVGFETPTDGATAANGVTASMTAENFTIEESGEIADNAGHFHIMVDEGAVETGEVIPSDETHLHFGDGSSRTVLDLDPGTYELTLQVGDGQHRALPLTDAVEVTVQEASISIESPADSATVESPVDFEFDHSQTLTVEPSGELSQDAGHYHLMVNEGPVDVGEVIPSDETHLHFGDGSTSVAVDLPEGTHNLTLQMGDGQHYALPETDDLTLTVE